MNLKSYFQRQKMMSRVLLALIPIYLFSVWLFGWRIVPLFAVVAAAGILAEYWIMRQIQGTKAKVSEACLVSCALYTLTLPPLTPFWIAIIGIVFGIIIGKCAFGGFGRNIFNPALVARCFVYVCFPEQLTAQWAQPFSSFPGGFARFSAAGSDLLTSATPMIEMRAGAEAPGLNQLIFGLTGGSLGETSAILIALAAVYLIITQTASWRLILSSVASGVLISGILYLSGQSNLAPHVALLSGGFLFGSVFMVTDPVSAPKDSLAQIIYAVLIVLITFVIRLYSLFTEGMMFAILIGNSFAPLIERTLKDFRVKLQAKKSKVSVAQATSDAPVSKQAGGQR